MLTWFLRQLNFSDELIRHLGDVHLDVQRPLVLLVGLLLLIPISFFIYYRQKRNLPTVPFGLRLTLTVTRVLILLLLVLVLAAPFARLDHRSENKPVVGVLLDHSQSMHLPAGLFESDDELLRVARAAGFRSEGDRVEADVRRSLNRMVRARLAQTVLENSARGFFQKLGNRYDVRYYSFGQTATRLGIDPKELKFPEPPVPGASSTRIGEAIAQVQDDTAGVQLAGIVLFSDGNNNAGRSPVDALRAAAAPLFAVPVGTSTRQRDVAIVDVFATTQVTVQDTATVAVTVESHGFEKRPVKVVLRDGDVVLQEKEVVLHDAEQQQIELTFKAEKPGLRHLTVSVPVQPEEPEHLRSNNTDHVFVRVSEEKLKVLLVDGTPRWDFRFLKNTLRRDNGIGGRTAGEPDVLVETEWRRMSKEAQAKALPRTIEQMQEYHTIVLGDVSPTMLDRAFLELLDRAVREKGVGLIVQAGPVSMPHRHADKLHELLPVRLERGKPGRQPRGIPSFRLELAPEGMLNEATRFYDEPGRNQMAWANLPRYYWSAAVEKPAPGATTLVYNPIPTAFGKMPLVAHHYAGQGRVLFVGTDETFRWRQNVGERFFARFWGQSVRFVARRDEAGSKKSRLEARPYRTPPGEPVEVELMAFKADGAPMTDGSVKVQVAGGGKFDPVAMRPDPLVPGRSGGRFTPMALGEYVVSATGLASPLEARVRVTGAAEEMRQPNVDRYGMAQLAGLTGGRLVELSDLATIEEDLRGESRYTELRREISIWDNWLVLTLLIVLYTLDVGLRRLMGLS